MESDSRGQSTPNRKENNERLETTGQKMKMEEALVDSKYEYNESGRDEGSKQDEGETQREESEKRNQLNEIEQEIKKIEGRLVEIVSEQGSQKDRYSDRAMDLAHEKANLKKRLLDLQYINKVQITNAKRRERAQRQRLLKEAEEERERNKKQVEDRLQKEREESERRRNQSTRKGEEQSQQGKQPQEGEQRKKDHKDITGQSELARSRRQQRISQIEVELAESRLRRSRMAALNAEIVYLRATYHTPYWTWRDYDIWRSTYYPYSLYPYLYTSPYYTSYLYPYSSYSYLYPYRYRHRYI